jgi:hypothetical protein
VNDPREPSSTIGVIEELGLIDHVRVMMSAKEKPSGPQSIWRDPLDIEADTISSVFENDLPRTGDGRLDRRKRTPQASIHRFFRVHGQSDRSAALALPQGFEQKFLVTALRVGGEEFEIGVRKGYAPVQRSAAGVSALGGEVEAELLPVATGVFKIPASNNHVIDQASRDVIHA